jgi:transcriptional regulator with XRE-family HTH domain
MSARTPDSTIGRVLRANVERQLRLRGMTLAELREAAGLNRRTYSQMFKTSNGPRTATLVRLADALGCRAFELLLPDGDGGGLRQE